MRSVFAPGIVALLLTSACSNTEGEPNNESGVAAPKIYEVNVPNQPEFKNGQTAGAAVPFAYQIFDLLYAPLVTTTLGALCGLIVFLWQRCKNIQGVRVWARRIAHAKLEPDIEAASDAFVSCYRIERHQRQLEASVVGLVVVLVLLQASLFGCWLGRLYSARSIATDVLLAEIGLMIFLAVVLCALLAVDAGKWGLPSREEDEATLERLARAQMQRLADVTQQSVALSDSDDLTLSRDTEHGDPTVATRLGIPPRTTLGQMLNWSPEPFQRVVGQRMQRCLQSFRPKDVFHHERDCVDHLSNVLRNARARAQRDVDVLAVCVDKTLGADHVARYSRENIEAARAGVYISRVFAYEPHTQAAVLELARAQLAAGVNVYTIRRDDLVEQLKRVYKLDLLSFTVVRGGEGQPELVLHAGAGETIHAASYCSALLAEYFADIHGAIRTAAQRARPERALRTLDESRSPVQLEWRGTKLNAMRIDYESAAAAQSAMSVTLLNRIPRGQSLVPNQEVRVSSSTLGIPDQRMRVSHVHCVDNLVCRRREHTNCLRARDGDYYLGLKKVA